MKGVCKMSSSRVDSLRVDTARHLEQSSRQSESIKVLEKVVSFNQKVTMHLI